MECYNSKLSLVKSRLKPNGKKDIIHTHWSWSTWVKDNGATIATEWRKATNSGFDIKSFEPMKRPCGKCEACHLNDARHYTTRALCELQEKGDGCFLTLTYSDKYLPRGGMYNERHITRFVARLRDRLRAFGNPKISTFGIAEYGGRTFRAHFHLCIFGWSPPLEERIPWRKNQHSPGFSYRHDLLDDLWNLGHIEAGDLTPQSISYCARYTLKKSAKNRILPSYAILFPEKKVCISRRPGIGGTWCDETQNNVLEQGYIFDFNQKLKLPVPRYVQERIGKREAQKLIKLKTRQRFDKLHRYERNGTKKRLKDRRELHSIKTSRLKRNYENDL